MRRQVCFVLLICLGFSRSASPEFLNTEFKRLGTKTFQAIDLERGCELQLVFDELSVDEGEPWLLPNYVAQYAPCVAIPAGARTESYPDITIIPPSTETPYVFCGKILEDQPKNEWGNKPID